MPISFNLDKHDLIVRQKATGSVSRDELFANLAALEPSLSTAAALLVLADFREVERLVLSTVDLREMKSAANATLKHREASARVAVVVSNKLHFGLARMYSMMQEIPEFEVAVFMDVDEAEAWLGAA